MKWERVRLRIDYGSVPQFTSEKERAEWNRYIIENKLFIIGYIQIEEALRRIPRKEQLPKWIRLGKVPGHD